MSGGGWASIRWVTLAVDHLPFRLQAQGQVKLVQLLRFHLGGVGTSAACSMQWAG